MSFDKAIIKRFNEEISCAPPPTKYDPKLPLGTAKDWKFGQCPTNSKNSADSVFATPGKPIRGRPLLTRSASTRSSSDTRLRKGQRSDSTNTIHEFRGAAADTPRSHFKDVETQSEGGDSEFERFQQLYQLCSEELQAANAKIVAISGELEDCKEKVQLSQVEVDHLRKENDTLNQNVDQYKTANKKQMTETQDLVSNLETVKSERQELEEKYQQLDAKFQEKKTELEVAGRKMEELRLSHDLCQDELQTIKAEFEVQTEKYNATAQELRTCEAKVQASDIEIENLRKENANLTQNVESNKAEVQDLYSTLEAVKSEREELESKYQQIDTRFLEKKAELEVADRKMEELKLAHDLCQDELQTVTAKFEALTDRYNTSTEKLRTCEEKVQVSEFELENLRKEIGSLTENLDQYKAQFENQTVESKELHSNLEAMKSQRNELEFKNQQLDTQLCEKEALLELECSKLIEMSRAHDVCQTELQELKTKLEVQTEEYNATASELNIIKSKNQAVEALVEQLRKENANLTQNLDQNKAVNEKQISEIQDLLSTLDTMKSEREELEEKYHQLETQLCEKETGLEVECNKMNELRQAHDVCQAELQRVTAQFEALTVGYNTTVEELRNCEEKVLISQVEIDNLRKENDILNQNADQFKEQIEKQTEDARDLLENLETVKSEREELESKYLQLGAQLHEKETQLELECSKIQELSQAHDLCQAELQTVTAKFEELKDGYNATVQELRIFEEKVEASENQVENLRKENDILTQNVEQYKEQIEKQIANAQTLFSNLEAEKSEREELESKYQQLETQLREKETQLELECSKLEELNRAHDVCQTELQELTAKFDVQTEKYNTITNELLISESKNQAVEALVQQLREENGILAQNLDQYKVLYEKQMTEAQDLLLNLAAVKSERDELEEKLHQLDTQLREKGNELEVECSKMEELRRVHDLCQAELQTVTAQFEALTVGYNSTTEELRACVEKVRASEMEVDNLQKENGILTQYVDQYKALNEKQMADALDLVSNLEKVKSERKDLESKYQQVDSQLRDKEKQLELEWSKMEELRQAHDQCKLELKCSMAQFAALTEEYNKVSKELLNSNGKILESDAVIKKMWKENAALKRSLGEYKVVNDKSMAETKDLRSSLEAMKSERQELQEKYAEINTLLSEMESSCNSLKLENKSLKDEFAVGAKRRLQELMLENESLKENIAHYERVYGDYASLVGHQNTRQKIQHVIKIKDENIKLRDEITHLRQKVAELSEKLKHAGTSSRRFDPSQAFKPILKEPFVRDERDVRGPDARSTFTVPRRSHPTPTVKIVDTFKKESKQGMAFEVTFSENKEN